MARENPSQPSLNDCLHPGSPLQNLLLNVLIRARFYPVLLAGDLQKAFLQVRIKEEERDALRFHWKSRYQSVIESYRFPEKFGRGVRPASHNPYPIYDQNLRFSLPYL